jgi:hypothetical protein
MRLLGLLFLGSLLLLSPGRAWAALTCVGDIGLTYVNPPVGNLHVGDVLTVKGTFGSGDILGGTKIDFTTIQLDLDCDLNFPLTPPCTDAGPVISYDGDATITTTCPGVTWSSDNPGGGTLPNQVEFTASPAVSLGPDIVIPPGSCDIEFNVTIVNFPTKGLTVGEILGYQLAFCDNGLDSGGFQTAAGTFAAPGSDFSCYETPRKNKLTPAPTVSLVDRFGSSSSTVTDYHRLCAPTDKNGDNPSAPSFPDHLVAGALTKTAGTIAQPTGMQITYQFGVLTADLSNPVFLLLPASKSHTSPAPPPPTDIRHFQCYRLTNVKGDRTAKDVLTIDQSTQPFGGVDVDLTKTGPWRLCVPVNKNGEDPDAVTDPQALLCNSTSNDKLPFGQFDVFVDTQLGPKELIGTQYDELCMPATVVIP